MRAREEAEQQHKKRNSRYSNTMRHAAGRTILLATQRRTTLAVLPRCIHRGALALSAVDNNLKFIVDNCSLKGEIKRVRGRIVKASITILKPGL